MSTLIVKLYAFLQLIDNVCLHFSMVSMIVGLELEYSQSLLFIIFCIFQFAYLQNFFVTSKSIQWFYGHTWTAVKLKNFFSHLTHILSAEVKQVNILPNFRSHTVNKSVLYTIYLVSHFFIFWFFFCCCCWQFFCLK